jgi:TPP-dependent pyruvate/acetoin dehydrogenase alpha subunit
MLKDHKATQSELDAINLETAKEIEDAVAFAKQSPSPKPEDATAFLFVS